MWSRNERLDIIAIIMLSVESAPRSSGKHVSFALDGHGSSIETTVYSEVSKTSLDYFIPRVTVCENLEYFAGLTNAYLRKFNCQNPSNMLH